MDIMVLGGTGTAGAAVVRAARDRGHQVVAASRRTGVDVLTGAGLDEACAAAEAVIDVSSILTLSGAKAIKFFTTASNNILGAAERAGTGQVVRLSIIGVDRNPHGFYAGQHVMEQIYRASAVPSTVLRASQFHEFAAQTLQRSSLGPVSLVPRARVQPVAVREVADRLVRIAESGPLGRVRDLAGPVEEDLAEMVRSYARRISRKGLILPARLPGAMMRGMAAGLQLPGPDAQQGRQTFGEWLAEQR